jgi:hypothetical protein
MAASTSTSWTYSSKANPCPICSRITDGDCRMSRDGEQVICHHPKDHKPGTVIDGWAFTSNTKDGRASHWVLDQPKPDGWKAAPFKPKAAAPQTPLPAPISGPIHLSLLPEPAPAPGHRQTPVVYSYSSTQQARRTPKPAGGKVVIPWHHDGTEWDNSAGPDHWPVYREAEALAADGWVVELEGEPCCDWARAGGAVAISQPGHLHTTQAIRPRYARLKAAGVAGVVFVSDNDAEGLKRAKEAEDAAAWEGLPFLHLPAVDVWPGIPKKGSIDDAPGTPAERVAAIEAVVPQALSRAQRTAPETDRARLAAAITDGASTADLAELVNSMATETGQSPGGIWRLVEAITHEQQQGGKDLDRIRMAADQVAAENLNWSRVQYVHRLREVVETDLSVPARDDLYRREIGEAIIRRDGIESRPFIGGCELPDDTEEWIIEALILSGALNIIGADPKAGKTLLSVALIASLLHGYQQFIGCDITGRPPTVIIVGPDQPVRLWKKQLKAVGLVQGNILDPRIVQLWDSQNPWAATTEGIAELRQLCAKHPGSLVLFDSFAKVSEKLGIDENSREAAEVLTDIERACIVSRCTPLVIHHNGKSAGRAGIVNGGALRGSGAIRANASQVAVLTLIDQDNPKDPRRRLVTEGRGGEFIDAVIQLEEDGWSWRHVCGYSEHRTAAAAQRTREKLSPGQQAALDAVEASSDPLTTAQVWAALNPETPWANEKPEAKNLSRTLSGLAQKNLLDRFQGTAYRPTFARKVK